MNDVLQCLASEPVPDLLRLSGLIALPIVLRLALLRVRCHGLGLVEPERQLPFFDGIPFAGQQPQEEETGSAEHPRRGHQFSNGDFNQWPIHAGRLSYRFT